jgi:hypothetical protein
VPFNPLAKSFCPLVGIFRYSLQYIRDSNLTRTNSYKNNKNSTPLQMVWLVYQFFGANTTRHQLINPNPHCFIAITKATACGWKEPLLPHPLHSTVGGGGCYLYGSEDLLKGTVSRDFQPLVFSLNCTPGFNDSWAKTVLRVDLNSRRYLIKYDEENRPHAISHSGESRPHAMRHNAESQPWAMLHSAESQLPAMWHSTE